MIYDTFKFLEKSFVKGLHNSPEHLSRVLYKSFPEYMSTLNPYLYYISYDLSNIFFKYESRGLSLMNRFMR